MHMQHEEHREGEREREAGGGGRGREKGRDMETPYTSVRKSADYVCTVGYDTHVNREKERERAQER